MKKYDVIVIGSGAGASVVESSLAHGMSVALIAAFSSLRDVV